jgi:hypothetical protein
MEIALASRDSAEHAQAIGDGFDALEFEDFLPQSRRVPSA